MSEKPAPAAGWRRDDSVEQFTQQVAALCQGSLRIPALAHLDRHEQIMQAEDDLNRTSRDWHTRIVTLNEVKGLAVRCFAALSMTPLRGSMVKCTNVLNSGLEEWQAAERFLTRWQAVTTDLQYAATD